MFAYGGYTRFNLGVITVYDIGTTKKNSTTSDTNSLERSHGEHSRDTLLYTVAQISIILFNFCVVNTDYNLVLE